VTRRIIMAWTLMFAACGGDVVEVPPVEEEPWSALEWRVGSTELGDVTAYAEHGDRLAVCTSTQAVLLAPGLSVRELERPGACRAVASLPRPGGHGRWVVSVDMQGALQGLDPADDVAGRYGLGGFDVHAIRNLGANGAAIRTSDGLVVSLAEFTGWYELGATTNLTTGGGRVAVVRGSEVIVLDPAEGRQRVHALTAARSIALDADGRLIAVADGGLFVEGEDGLARTVLPSGSGVDAVAHARGTTWFVINGELASRRGERFAVTEGAGLGADIELREARSGGLWIHGDGRLRIFDPPVASRSWLEAIQPIYDRTCRRCHADMDTEASWRARRDQIQRRVVEEPAMPPRGEPPITDEERAMIAAWLVAIGG